MEIRLWVNDGMENAMFDVSTVCALLVERGWKPRVKKDNARAYFKPTDCPDGRFETEITFLNAAVFFKCDFHRLNNETYLSRELSEELLESIKKEPIGELITSEGERPLFDLEWLA